MPHAPSAAGVPVRFRGGIELPSLGLWLDPREPRQLAFVSHAHSDHLGRHREVILSAGTARLMRERLPGERVERVLSFGEPFEHPALSGARLTLLPAGHLFGSAQLFAECAEGTLLYSGDFKLRPGLSAERVVVRPAETLIMETTFGKPRYRFPPTETVLEEMLAFCREALEEEAVPVLLGYSLGKAQEILCALLRAGLTPVLHGAVHRMTEIYREALPGFPGGYLRYGPKTALEGRVLLCPPSAARSPMVRNLTRRRVAVLTGWAVDARAKYLYGVDAAFPLSDHADYDDLLRYVELAAPRRVWTVHGFAAEFARDLRERGVEAWPLTGEAQLELSLMSAPRPFPSAPVPAPAPEAPAAEADPLDFAAFAAVCAWIGATPAKGEKIALLSGYFQSLAARDEAALALAAVYLAGRPFPQSDFRALGTGWAVIKRALLAAAPIGEVRLRSIADRHADAGKTAAEALAGHTAPEPWALPDSRRFFEALRGARGPVAKTTLLASRLSRLGAQEGGALVRILTGDLRIGLKEGLVEEAIAAAFEAPPEEVRQAHMLLGDLGETARLARERRLGEAGLRLFRPVRVMLASPEPGANEVWERFKAAGAAWLEPKYDGIRAQAHWSGGRVELYSRDLKPVTAQFPELAEAAARWPGEAILDGEIVAWEDGARLTFFDLQKRLGRTEPDLFLGRTEIPVVFVAFDLLYQSGQTLLRLPLEERRRRLEALALPPRFERITRETARSAAEIGAAFRRARLAGREGLIAKDPQSAYTPGRRGLAWIKLKKELATLDVVVVGAENGHGRRAAVLSDYTFAVRDGESGALLPIGKAYSGLTDAEIAELTTHFTRQTVARRGRYREVVPDVVLEVAFDSIHPSSRHPSGLALRFPRIKAIRRDKTPAEIDTLAYARQLATEARS